MKFLLTYLHDGHGQDDSNGPRPTSSATDSSAQTSPEPFSSDIECQDLTETSKLEETLADQGGKKNSTDYYRGFLLDIRSIVRKAGEDILLVFHEKTRVVTAGKGSRKRMFVKCLVCEQYEEEARRCSSNSRVFIAQVVRCDSKKSFKMLLIIFLALHIQQQWKENELKLFGAQGMRGIPGLKFSRQQIPLLCEHLLNWLLMLIMTVKT